MPGCSKVEIIFIKFWERRTVSQSSLEVCLLGMAAVLVAGLSGGVFPSQSPYFSMVWSVIAELY